MRGRGPTQSAHVSPGREASWHTNAAKLLRHHDRKRKLRFRAGCPAKGVAQAARLTQHRPQRKLLSHGHLLPKRNKKDCTVSRSYVVEVGDRITRRSVDGAGRGRSVDIQANRAQLSAALRVPRGKTSPQLVFSSVSSSCAPLQFGQGRQQGPLGGGGRVGAWCCACFPSARLTSLCDRRGKVLRPNNIPKIPACCDCPVCHYAFLFLRACGSLMYRTPGAPCDRARNVACMPSS